MEVARDQSMIIMPWHDVLQVVRGVRHLLSFKAARFMAESFMDYQADQIACLYDLNYYMYLLITMTTLDRNSLNLAEGTRCISCHSLIIAIMQDLLAAHLGSCNRSATTRSSWKWNPSSAATPC